MDSPILLLAERLMQRYSRHIPFRSLDYFARHFDEARRVGEGERWPVLRIWLSFALIAAQFIKFIVFYFGDFDHHTRWMWFDMFHIESMPKTYNLAISFLLIMVGYYVYIGHYSVNTNPAMKLVHRVAVRGEDDIFLGPANERANLLIGVRRLLVFALNYMASFRVAYLGFVGMVQIRLIGYFLLETPDESILYKLCLEANALLFFVWSYHFVYMTGISSTIGVTMTAIIMTRFRQMYTMIRFDRARRGDPLPAAPTSVELQRFYRQHTQNLSLIHWFDLINWTSFSSYIACNIPLNSLMVTHLVWHQNSIVQHIFMHATISGQFLGLVMFHYMAACYPPRIHRPVLPLIGANLRLSRGGALIENAFSRNNINNNANLNANANRRMVMDSLIKHRSIHDKLKLSNYIDKFCTTNRYGLRYWPGLGLVTMDSLLTVFIF